MAKAIVLGGGMVGSVMAADLAKDEGIQVTLADLRPEALEQAVARAGGALEGVRADLSDPDAVQRLVADHDVVLGALASHLGFGALRAVIEARKPYADISFMPEDALALDELAQQRGVAAVVDCGVAPGMSNLLAGWGATLLDRCDRIEILVGGLPVERRWPWEYKAAFAPADVLEEYTRPARLVERGELVVRPALSEPELVDFDELGTLEAVNTDGLRSLAHTLDVPYMIEKTLRYPGHVALMRILAEAGFFSKEPVSVGGERLRPLDLTSALLFPQWSYEEGEEDLTVMRVTVEGEAACEHVRHRWELFDRYSRAERATSMSRTTALPCAVVARLLLDGSFAEPGVHPPEVLGARPGMAERVLAALADRGIHYEHEREAAAARA